LTQVACLEEALDRLIDEIVENGASLPRRGIGQPR
jgi:hypothetical protein